MSGGVQFSSQGRVGAWRSLAVPGRRGGRGGRAQQLAICGAAARRRHGGALIGRSRPWQNNYRCLTGRALAGAWLEPAAGLPSLEPLMKALDPGVSQRRRQKSSAPII